MTRQVPRRHACAPIIFGACLILGSCRSVPSDATLPLAPAGEGRAALESLEDELVGLQLDPPGEEAGRDELTRRRARLRGIDEAISAMASRAWDDQGFRLDCMALAGESALFSGDSVTARRWLAAADELSGYGSAPGVHDPAPILRARLIPDLGKRLEVLTISVDPRLQDSRTGAVPGRLLCELAFLRARLGMAEEARSAMEAGLAALRPSLRTLYAWASSAIVH